MPNIQAISLERHASKYWLRSPNFAFAAGDAMAPLLMRELPTAIQAFPVAFCAVADAFMIVAIQNLKPGKNLFVGLDGRWIGSYVPAAYRSYPFVLASAEDGKQVLCIDEDSGLVSDLGGEPFFGEDGQPSKVLADVLDFLSHIAANRVVTQRVCAVLQKHNLIQPWPITLQGEEGERPVEGYYRIDETKMNQLPPEAFIELRDTGALMAAYCQLLSMQLLPQLQKLAAAHARAATAALPVTPNGDLDLSFLSDGGSLDLGGLY